MLSGFVFFYFRHQWRYWSRYSTMLIMKLFIRFRSRVPTFRIIFSTGKISGITILDVSWEAKVNGPGILGGRDGEFSFSLSTSFFCCLCLKLDFVWTLFSFSSDENNLDLRTFSAILTILQFNKINISKKVVWLDISFAESVDRNKGRLYFNVYIVEKLGHVEG